MFYLGLISLYHLSSLSLQGHKSGHAQCIGNDDMQIHSYTCINNLRTTWYDKPRLCFYAFCIAWSAQNGICLACLARQPSEIKNQNQNTFLLPSSLVTGPSEHTGSWGLLSPPTFNTIFTSFILILFQAPILAQKIQKARIPMTINKNNAPIRQ